MAKINLNKQPYYEDFDADKNFHQVLFKPGLSVQARELTQIQSILKDQIAKFGNHVFKNGSIVIPGNSTADIDVPLIKINTPLFDVTTLIGRVISASNGVTARVKFAVPATLSDPATLYIAYNTGGTAGEVTFTNSQSLFLVDSPSTVITTLSTSSSGFGCLASVQQGVYYVSGTFVSVQPQTVVLNKYTSVPSGSVLLKIKEEIITSFEDETLLDPAQGSFNFAAPGADRLRISLELVTQPLDFTVTDDYVELIRYRDGNLEYHNRFPKYSELEKSLARRTYDESGDYVVSGYGIKVQESLKTSFNDGLSLTGSRDDYALKVFQGKGYIRGFEVETPGTTTLVGNKGRTTDHVKTNTTGVTPKYGQYIYVTNLVSLPSVTNKQTVSFYNQSTGGTIIATASVIGLDFEEGDPTLAGAVYRLYYTDLSVEPSVLRGAARIEFTAGAGTGSTRVLHKYDIRNLSAADFVLDETVTAAGVRSGKVHRFVRSNTTVYLYKVSTNLPLDGDYITGATAFATIQSMTTTVSVGASLPLFKISDSVLKSLRNTSNAFDISYTTWKSVIVNTDASGNGSVTISDGVFAVPEAGVTVAAAPTGIVPLSKLSRTAPNVLSVIAGPVSARVVIISQVIKSNVTPKSKVLTTQTLNSVTPASIISLGKADVLRIVSIISGTVDVTSRYMLDNGQRDTFYGVGRIILTDTLPTSNLTITFQYFAHTGSGDFFSVDSYTSLGSDYLEKIPSYKSTSNSGVYSLKNHLDFRPRIDELTGNFTGGLASLADAVVPDTLLTTSLQFYIPRLDTIYLDKNSQIKLLRGTPSETPQLAPLSSDNLPIYILFIPPYTESVDSIFVKDVRPFRYTMSDISKIEKRVENLEYYSLLSATETNLLNYNELDPATGIARFKTGYLVDTFTNPFTVSDFYNGYNRASYAGTSFRPSQESLNAPITVNDSLSGNYSIRDGLLTLPFTEVPLIDQNTSTKVNNVNPFMVFAWEGVMSLTPSVDNWIVKEQLADINETINNTRTVTREVIIPYVPPPPPPPPPTPEAPPPPPVPVPPVIPTPDPVIPTIPPAEPVFVNGFTGTGEFGQQNTGAVDPNGVVLTPTVYYAEDVETFYEVLDGREFRNAAIDPVGYAAAIIINGEGGRATGSLTQADVQASYEVGKAFLREIGYTNEQIVNFVIQAQELIVNGGASHLTPSLESLVPPSVR